MESFSLLKYWRSSGIKATETRSFASNDSSDEDEEGHYFDMEFAIPDDNESENGLDNVEKDEKSDIEQDEGEQVELTIESSEHNVNVSISDENCKMPVSLQKSATKFRVLLLKLKKSKSGNGSADKTETDEGNDEVKAPLVSFFTRDNSSKQNNFKVEESSVSNVASDEKKLSKEVLQKYLNMVKPMYTRVSKRYVEKLHLNFIGGDSKNNGAAEKSGEELVTSCVKSNVKHGNISFQAGLKVVRKHLGKSRSASETVGSPMTRKMASERHDDSLLQVQDGIQGAILHCKKSFNASGDVESSSALSRSASDPSNEKSLMMGTVSSASASS